MHTNDDLSAVMFPAADTLSVPTVLTSDPDKIGV